MTQITPSERARQDGLCVGQTFGATRLLWLNLPKRCNALSPRIGTGRTKWLAAERGTQAILYTSEDFAEGYEAFFEKRAPDFQTSRAVNRPDMRPGGGWPVRIRPHQTPPSPHQLAG